MNKTVYFVVVLTAFLVQPTISDGGRHLGKQTSRRRIDKSNSRDLEPEKPSVTWHQSTFSPPRSDDDLPSSRKYLARRTSSDDVRADGRADHPKRVRSRKENEKKKESAGSPSRSGFDWGIGRSPPSSDDEDRYSPEMVNAARRPYTVQDYTRARDSGFFETDRYRPEMVNLPFRPTLDGVGKDGRSTSFDEDDRLRPEMVNVARRQSPDTRAKGSNPFDKNRYMPEIVNAANRPSPDGTGKVGRSSVDEGGRFGPEKANVASPDKVKDYARAKAEHPSKKLKERSDSKRSAGSLSFNSWASWSTGVRVPSPKWQELPSRRTLLYLMTRRGKALENLPMVPGDVVVCHLVKQRIVTRFHWFLAVSGSELLHLIPRDTKHQGLFARDQIDKVRKRFPNFDCNNCKNLGSGGYDAHDVEEKATQWVNRVTFYDEDSCSGYHWIVWWITSTIPKPVRFVPGFNKKLHRDCRLNTIQRDPHPLVTDDVLLLPSMEDAAAYAREFKDHPGWPVELDSSSGESL